MRKFTISLMVLLSFNILVAVAVPAKRGQWKTVTLTDGSQVRVELVGDEFMHFWQPVMFKKYGLEELTELGLKMFCDPSFDDFWNEIDKWAERYPEFLDELKPILKEYEAKGSQDAVSVLEIINGLEEE